MDLSPLPGPAVQTDQSRFIYSSADWIQPPRSVCEIAFDSNHESPAREEEFIPGTDRNGNGLENAPGLLPRIIFMDDNQERVIVEASVSLDLDPGCSSGVRRIYDRPSLIQLN
jgi:hypothetical protein